MTTSTDPTDEVEVPHLKDRLWQELARLHAEQPSDHATATVTEIARRRARRSLRLGVAAAAAAVVVVAVGVQLAGTGGPSDGELVVERVAAATDDAIEASVVHSTEVQQRPNGSQRRLDTWHDEETGIARFAHYDDQGAPWLEAGPLTAPTLADPTWSGQRVVIHCSRTYVDHVDTDGATTELPAGVSDFRDLLADGTVVEDGTEVFEGRELIRLRGEDFVLLADPDTYRVVAQRGTLSTGETYTSTVEYIPRTDASLASLVPAIPTGYTPLPPGPAEDSCLPQP